MFSVRDRIFFHGSCTLADLVSPSRLETSSLIWPIFHVPRGKFSLMRTICPVLGVCCDRIRFSFRCV